MADPAESEPGWDTVSAGGHVILDEAALRDYFASPNGPVAEEISRVAIMVESVAKVNATGAPVAGARNPGHRGPRVRTGRLRSSITWVLGEDGQGLYADVGTNVYYGRYLELGLLPNGNRYPFLKPALDTVVGPTPAALPGSAL